MSHERILRCQSATFHVDGATYQIGKDAPLHILSDFFTYKYVHTCL